MASPPLDLKAARILISNDDGIEAPGLKRLEKVARRLAREVWVVAPAAEQSGPGHSLTLRRPLRLRRLAERRFAVDGTPTDAVLLAVNRIMKGFRPDLVLSGFNRGANVGEDMTYSGTIAAAMEATLLGIPAIALSQQVDERSSTARVHWATAEAFAPGVIRKLVSVAWPREVLMNVNFPHAPKDRVAGIEITREGRRKVGDEIVEGFDPRGRAYYWIGAQQSDARSARGTDISALARGKVSVTPVSLDMTHRGAMRELRKVFTPGSRDE